MEGRIAIHFEVRHNTGTSVVEAAIYNDANSSADSGQPLTINPSDILTITSVVFSAASDLFTDSALYLADSTATTSAPAGSLVFREVAGGVVNSDAAHAPGISGKPGQILVHKTGIIISGDITIVGTGYLQRA